MVERLLQQIARIKANVEDEWFRIFRGSRNNNERLKAAPAVEPHVFRALQIFYFEKLLERRMLRSFPCNFSSLSYKPTVRTNSLVLARYPLMTECVQLSFYFLSAINFKIICHFSIDRSTFCQNKARNFEFQRFTLLTKYIAQSTVMRECNYHGAR